MRAFSFYNLINGNECLSTSPGLVVIPTGAAYRGSVFATPPGCQIEMHL